MRRKLLPKALPGPISPEGRIDTSPRAGDAIVGAWLEGGGSRLVLVQRDGERRSRVEVSARWSLFVRRAGLPAEVERELRRCAMRVEQSGEWLRADWRDREARDGDRRGEKVRGARRWLESQGVAVYEGDVSPLRRHLSDSGADVACSLDHACYYDLETDSRVPFSRKEDARILSWAVVSHATGEVESGVLAEDSDTAESDLLRSFLRAVAPYDTCAAWNGERFDELVLAARCERRGLSPNWRRWCWLDHLQAYEKYAVAATGEMKTSLALDAVARAVLGEGKLGEGVGAKSWDTWVQDRDALLAYNEQDARLMRGIERKTHYLRVHFAVCRLCRCLPTTRSLRANELADGYLLRLGAERGHRWPSKPHREDAVSDPFEGAYVMDPKPGVYEGVAAVDFASLYPSVIVSMNVSPETLMATPEERDAARAAGVAVTIEPKTGATFRAEPPGLFPIAIDALVTWRDSTKAAQAEVPAGSPEWEDLDGQSRAAKVVVNSFYGLLGSPTSRYYVRECGRAVSQGARWLTENLLELARYRAVEVVYADTDSMYMRCGPDVAAPLVREFNERVAPLLARQGCLRNTVRLDYEKDLRRIVIVSAKRYAAALSRYKGVSAAPDAEPEVKGLEWRRSDQVRLAREMQREAIHLLLRDGPLPSIEESRELALRWRARVLEGPLSLADVRLSQSIGKDEYAAKTPPPHARVAAILKSRGEDVSVGTRVAYWIARSDDGKLSPLPVSDWDESRVDRAYYWENRVWPPTRRLLEVALPGVDWTELDRPEGKRRRGRGDDGQGSLFDAAPAAESLALTVDGLVERDWTALWEAVRAVIAAHPGRCSVTIQVEQPGSRTTLALVSTVSADARRDLERLLGRAAISSRPA